MLSDNILLITLTGFIAGVVGTVSGAALAFLSKKTGKRFISFIMEMAAGLMLAVVSFELLPQAFTLTSLVISMIGLGIGIAFALLIQNFIKYDSHSKFKSKGIVGTGIVIVIGIGLHNLPEGLAIGSGFDASVSLGLALTLVIALHNIPEGMALALPLRLGGWGITKTMLIAFAAGLPMAVGACLGSLVGGVSKEAVGFCLAFAGGAMLYIVCGDIIPESKELYKGRISAVGNIIGFVLGIIISVALE